MLKYSRYGVQVWEGCWRALQNGLDMFGVFQLIRYLSNFLDKKTLLFL
jgi:hypothetical protein